MILVSLFGSSRLRADLLFEVGRFGLVHGDWPLWTADTDNPSIAASTGFPVCLPRVDPAVELDVLCPDYNRPVDTSGKPLTGLSVLYLSSIYILY